MKTTNRIIALPAVLALLLCFLPTTIVMPASALSIPSDSQVSVATWNDFREALMSPDVTDVYVAEGVTIQHTFDADREIESDVRVDVVGTKRLKIDGSVEFTGSINDTGLICIWESSCSLTVCGSGSLVYRLRHGVDGDVIHIEEGNLFYLSGGTLTIQDNVQISLHFGWVDANHVFEQAPIGGVRGKVNIEGGIISGHTILSQGIDWTVSGGFFDCAAQYDYDMAISSGSMNISGGSFEGGIYYSGNSVILREGAKWISADGNCYDTVQSRQAGLAWKCGFAIQEPTVSDGMVTKDLGTIAAGMHYPIRFSANSMGYSRPSWNLSTESHLYVYDGNRQLVEHLVAAGSTPVDYNLNSLAAGDYSLVETVMMKKGDKEVTSTSHTFTVTVTDSIQRLTRAEVYEIQRPAPGQHPDFTCDLDNPPHCTTPVIRWYALDAHGTKGAAMTANDTFKENTVYRVEILLNTIGDRVFDFYDDEAYVWFNREDGHFYYPEQNDFTSVILYADYDTANCITDINIIDVQYPIPGETPDTDFLTVDPVGASKSGTQIEWYYETNPGTSAAGFARLDGTFRADRRHQAYVPVETKDGYWFATDNQGDLAVNVTFDGEPMDFAYATDPYTDDGAVSAIEVAHTFERAQEVDGVFIDGMWLTDGQYLDSANWGIKTEETVDKEAGYAYYNDGVLTLHNFSWYTRGDYNAIDSYNPLIIKAEGESRLTSFSNGIVANDTLTLEGDGSLRLYSSGEGLFAIGDMTVESGEWYVIDDKYDGMWLYSSLTVNGGTLDVYGPQCGINGDDFPPVTVNGGTLIARAAVDYAIGWCDTEIADGAKVTVGTYDSDTLAPWDGVTDFAEYAYVEIAFEGDALLGDLNFDGVVNMMDALLLYGGTGGARNLTPEQAAVADVSGDGTVNMMDALLLYKVASGA